MRTKSLKKFLSLLLVAVLVSPFLTFAACDLDNGSAKQATVLAAPSGIEISDATLSWDSVTNAKGYLVRINNETPIEIPKGTTSYSLEELTDSGIYAISVKAKGDGKNYLDSVWPTSIAYVVEEQQGELTVLAAPANLEITEGALSWTAVQNASGYEVRINNGTPQSISSTSFSLATLTDVGAYAISVKSKGDGITYLDSSWPSNITYIVEEQKPEPNVLAAPDGLQIADATLSWNAVSNASGYEIRINDGEPVSVQAGVTIYSLESLTEEGIFIVSVRTKGNGTTYLDSIWPATISYVIIEDATVLTSPSNLTIDGTSLTWSQVENASGYYVMVDNGTPVLVESGTSYSLASLTQPGSYVISVKAKGDGNDYLDSLWPSTIVYTIQAPSVAEDYVKPVGYYLVVEGFEWGPAITKLIMQVSDSVEADSIDKDTFTVKAENTTRTILNAFISDSNGNRQDTGSSYYVTIEMRVGYQGYSAIENSSPFVYSQSVNRWRNLAIYSVNLASGKTITLGGTVYNRFSVQPSQYRGKISPSTDNLEKGRYTYQGQTLTYASYNPPAGTGKLPLIIWLHGAGEGGTDIDIALLGNDVTELMESNIQSKFIDESRGITGAYVLVCQTPTMWMDNGNGQNHSGNQPSVYTDALMALIKNFVGSKSNIDKNRIYIGGCSNGGYMTINMLLKGEQGYFAGAYPVCEAYMDSYVSEDDIEIIKNIPIWFTAAANDTTVNPRNFSNATYVRLIRAGAENVHYSYFENVAGRDAQVSYMGHYSWVYTLQDRCIKDQDADAIRAAADLDSAKALVTAPSQKAVKIGDKEVGLWEWMAAQVRTPAPVVVADGKFEAEYADISNVIPSGNPPGGSIIERNNGSSNNASLGYLNRAGNKVIWRITSSAADNQAELKFGMGSGLVDFSIPGNGDLLCDMNEIKITVNGTVINFNEFLLEGTHTWTFNNWLLISFGTINLNQGQNEIVFEILGDVAPNMDYMQIISTSTLSWIPTENT